MTVGKDCLTKQIYVGVLPILLKNITNCLESIINDKNMNKIKISLYLLSFFSLIALTTVNSVAAREIDRHSNSAKNNSLNTKNFHQKSQGKITISAKDLLAQDIRQGNEVTERQGDEKTEKYVDKSLIVQGVTRVKGVKLNQTDRGLQIILETEGKQLVPLILPEGNSVAIDILDATLALPTGNEYRETNPAPGISEIAINPVDATSIRLTITGENQAPDAEIVPSNENLILSVTPEVTETADELEEINVVVTATRTEEEESDVDRSVTVIDRTEIEEQTNLRRDLGDILGREVPGLAPGNQSLSEFGQTLRGRNQLVLIDGVPQSSSRNAFRNLRTIDPSVIERIEIVRGPTALYGDGATGGIINIITQTGEGEPSFPVEVGFGGSLSNIDTDSFTGIAQAGVSAKQNNLDYRFNVAYDRIGAFFDGEGDRIPPDLQSSQGSLAETNNLNLFGKVGYELGEHRLELTANYYDSDQDTDFLTDPSVNEFPPGTQKALTRDGLELEEQPEIENTFINLDYDHPSLFLNSKVHAQIYYRDYLTRFFTFDGSDFGLVTPEGFSIFQSRVESEKYGGRLEIDTPIVGEDTLSLLSGLDYSDEDAEQPLAIFDQEIFEASNGTVFEQIDDRPWVPSLSQRNLGLFAQLNWQPAETVVVRGGLRYEDIGIEVDDFTTLEGNEIAGGDLDYDATLFNVGVVYKLSEEFSTFANFAQGFSVADVGLILRGAEAGFTVTELSPEAQKVDSYELGIRGQYDKVSFSLAGFYNESDLGTTFDRETFEVIRSPERVYGAEAVFDYQINDNWQIGSTFSFVEGDNDVEDDGDFEPLTGFRIPPVTLTAYVENETLPGWRNRIQMLYLGGRERAFDEDVDFQDVDPYVVFDLISSVEIGKGTLNLGIQNLFNNQYFTAISQLLRLRTNESYTAAPGITFSLKYAVEF